jgi:hypothetical protein
MLSPNPLLFELISRLSLSLVLKNGLNKFFLSSSLIPGPKSYTLISTETYIYSRIFTLTVVLTTSFYGENFTAFESKLSKIYWVLIESIIRQISFDSAMN